jgi:hypothetical protein
MTIIYRLFTPVDQPPSPWPNQYTEWNVDGLTSDWQVSLGGVMLGKNSEWCITEIDGIGLPSVRTNDAPEPFHHGESALGDFANSRTIVVEVAGRFASPAAAWDAIRELAGVWQPVIFEQPLRFRMTGDKSMMLIGHPRKMDVDSSGIRLGVVTVSLEFVANDPRFYNASLTQSSVALSSAGGGGFCFNNSGAQPLPHTPNFCFTTAPSDTVCIPIGDFGVRFVMNHGNAYTPPVFSIRGNVEDVTVQNAQSGQEWSWTGDVAGGELKADHLARTITLNGTEVYSGLSTTSEFFWLAPGETQINITVGTGTGTGFIRFRDAWF